MYIISIHILCRKHIMQVYIYIYYIIHFNIVIFFSCYYALYYYKFDVWVCSYILVHTYLKLLYLLSLDMLFSFHIINYN